MFAPLLAPFDPLAIDLAHKLEPPGAQFLLGTDQTGRDLASRIIWGSRQSVVISLSSIAIGCLFGITLGLVAGTLSGTLVESSIMRFFDLKIPICSVWSIAIIGIIGTGALKFGPIVLDNQAKLIALIGASFIPALGQSPTRSPWSKRNPTTFASRSRWARAGWRSPASRFCRMPCRLR